MGTDHLLSLFKEITRIPRESGHEEQIIAYLQKFAEDRNLECKTDEAGNVLIIKEATPGKENTPTIILQSHSDMVCEKNSGVEHDFAKDPIKYVIEDGWMIAKDTTLGADCGIGMAAQLALLEDENLEHGKIEALFTTAEETGLDGAKALKPGFLSGDILINLDSEDEGELFIGCAGGLDTTAEFHYTPKKLASHKVSAKFGYCGGLGGHSGDDIDKGRANAIQILGRFLYRAYEECGIELCTIDGGNKRNAIAREAYAVIAFNSSDEDRVVELFNETLEAVRDEYSLTDPNLQGIAEPIKWERDVIDSKTVKNLIYSLNFAPHGVLAMSASMKGMVETSTNLASVKVLDNNIIRVGTSQRSSNNYAKSFAGQRVEAAFKAVGAEVSHNSEYPGWQPRLDSKILETSVAAYKKLFNVDPIVRSIHAGLECGLFLDIYPNLDMISFGPTIRGVHAPGERLDLVSLDKFWLLLQEIIKSIK